MRRTLVAAASVVLILVVGASVQAEAPAAAVISTDFVINRDSLGQIWLVSGDTRYSVDAALTYDSILSQFRDGGTVRQFVVAASAPQAVAPTAPPPTPAPVAVPTVTAQPAVPS